MKLVAATGNQKKLREIRRILEHLGVEVVTPAELGVTADAVEDGETFRENAAIKAWDIFRKTGLPSLADDSGLSIDAMGGGPGVYSARYCGEDTPYSERFLRIFEELAEVPDRERTARFTSAICCVLDDETVIETEESCEGRIGHAPSGEGGFGYDPIFYPLLEDGSGGSFADLTDEEKDEISHRGKSLRAFSQNLEAYLTKNHTK